MFLIQNGYLNGLKENRPSPSPTHCLEESIHQDKIQRLEHFGGR